MDLKTMIAIGKGLFDLSKYVTSGKVYEDHKVLAINMMAWNLLTNPLSVNVGPVSLSVHCPVDVVITDADGTVLASTQGEEVTYNNDTDLKVLVHTEGDEKFFTIFGNGDLNISLTGTDTGTMDAEIILNGNVMETDTFLAYENVPLTNGKQMTLHISADRTDYGNEISVLDASGDAVEKIMPTEEVAPYLYGDLNQDNDLTVADAVMMSRLLTEDDTLESTEWLPLCDIDRDGLLTVQDISCLIELLKCKIS